MTNSSSKYAAPTNFRLPTSIKLTPIPSTKLRQTWSSQLQPSQVRVNQLGKACASLKKTEEKEIAKPYVQKIQNKVRIM